MRLFAALFSASSACEIACARFIDGVLGLLTLNECMCLAHLKRLRHSDITWTTKCGAMRKLFVEDALKKLRGEAVSDGYADFGSKEDETIVEHNAMFKAWVMNQKNYSLVHVDMASKLEELGLKDFFPMTSWPPAAAVRVCVHQTCLAQRVLTLRLQVSELATKIDRLKKQGVPAHYVYVNFRK